MLAGHGTVPHSSVEFSYKASDLALTGVEVLLGLAVGYLRIREPRPVTWLRRLHNGSVNDYAAFAAVGIALAAYVLIS